MHIDLICIGVIFILLFFCLQNVLAEEKCCFNSCFNLLPPCSDDSDLNKFDDYVCLDGDQRVWANDHGIFHINGSTQLSLTCVPNGCEDDYPDNDWESGPAPSDCNCTQHAGPSGWFDDQLRSYSCSKVHIGIRSDIRPVESRFTSRRLSSHGSSFPNARRLTEVDDGDSSITGTCNVFSTLVSLGGDLGLMVNVEGVTASEWIMVARKFTWSHVYHCSTSSCSVELPGELMSTSGSVTVTVIEEGQACGESSNYLVGTNMCRSSDCILCENALKHMKCLQPTERFFLIFMFIFIAFMMIIMFPMMIFWLIWVFRLIACLPWKVSSIAFGVYTSPFAKDSRRKWKEMSEYLMGKEKELPKPQEQVKTAAVGGGGRKLPSWAVLGVVIAVCAPVNGFVHPCSTSLAVDASFASCVTWGDADEFKNCTINNAMQITIPSIGTSACIELSRDDESGPVVVTTVEVSYLYAIDTITTTSAYWTSDFSESDCMIAKHVGQGGGGCSGSHVCGRINTNERPLSQDFGTYTCLLQTEHRYGCFHCSSIGNQACSMWAYGLFPQGPRYQVRNLQTQTLRPFVRFNVTDQTGGVTVKDLTISTTSQTVGGLTVQVLGTLDRGTINLAFSGKKLIRQENSNRAWISPASPTNSPQLNQIGDIQASTSAKLYPGFILSPPADFIMAQGLVVPVNNCPSPVSFDVSTPGIRQLETGNEATALPSLFGPDMWVWKPSTLQLTSNVSSPPPIITSLIFGSGLTVTLYESLVCPSFEIINATGCSSCTQGFLIYINARSSCSGGPADIGLNDDSYTLNTPVVNLKRVDGIYEIRGTTPYPESTFSLTMRAGDQSYSQEVYFVSPPSEANLTDPDGITNCANGATCLNVTSSKKDRYKDGLKTTSIGDLFKNTIPNFFEGVFEGLGSSLHEFIMVVVIGLCCYLAWIAAKMIASKYPQSYQGMLLKKVVGDKSMSKME